jgi:hypothetical protein
VSIADGGSARAAAWPADAALRLRAAGGAWPGLGVGCGVLEARPLRAEVGGRGVAAGLRTAGDALARTG